MATKRSIIAYIKIMDDKIICGVSESILFPVFREKIIKTFESFKGETYIQEVEFVKYFEQAPEEMAAQ